MQPPDSLFKGRQQSTGHLRLIAWRSTANTGVYLPLLTSSPNEHTFRGHRLPKNEKKTLSRSTADEGYQVSRRRDIAVPGLKSIALSTLFLSSSYAWFVCVSHQKTHSSLFCVILLSILVLTVRGVTHIIGATVNIHNILNK